MSGSAPPPESSRGTTAVDLDIASRRAQSQRTRTGGGLSGGVTGSSSGVPRGSTSASAAASAAAAAAAAAAGTEDTSFSDDTDEDSESDERLSDEDMSWISWFVGLKGNELFCEVDEDFIQDDFNLHGLASQVPYYDYALDVVLDVESPADEALSEMQQDLVESAAETLYGMIHARFILTARGLAAMHEKFKDGDFGRCPRVLCQGQHVLPVGQSDALRTNTVKIYCPRCEDIYYPRSSRQGHIDGAYFGTSFAHVFMMQYGEAHPTAPKQTYVPRVYGFRVHKPGRPSHRTALLRGAAKKGAKDARRGRKEDDEGKAKQ